MSMRESEASKTPPPSTRQSAWKSSADISLKDQLSPIKDMLLSRGMLKKADLSADKRSLSPMVNEKLSIWSFNRKEVSVDNSVKQPSADKGKNSFVTNESNVNKILG